MLRYVVHCGIFAWTIKTGPSVRLNKFRSSLPLTCVFSRRCHNFSSLDFFIAPLWLCMVVALEMVVICIWYVYGLCMCIRGSLYFQFQQFLRLRTHFSLSCFSVMTATHDADDHASALEFDTIGQTLTQFWISWNRQCSAVKLTWADVGLCWL